MGMAECRRGYSNPHSRFACHDLIPQRYAFNSAQGNAIKRPPELVPVPGQSESHLEL